MGCQRFKTSSLRALLFLATLIGVTFAPRDYTEGEGRIYCLGERSATPLPVVGDFDPNAVSMQELCVRTKYGGGAPHQHLGFYCYDRSRGMVAMDESERAESNSQLQTPRLAYQCRLRCFCDSWDWRTATAKPLSRSYATASHDTWEISPEVQADLTRPRRGSLNVQYVQATQVNNEYEDVVRHYQLTDPNRYYLETRRQVRDPEVQPDWILLSLDPANKIECNGNLPDFPLPPPFTNAWFLRGDPLNGNQRLCAVQFSGGDEYVLYIALSTVFSKCFRFSIVRSV